MHKHYSDKTDGFHIKVNIAYSPFSSLSKRIQLQKYSRLKISEDI